MVAPLIEGDTADLVLAQRLGVGGFARPVVLKLVHPELNHDRRALRRFLAEASLSAHIDHPNVVHVEAVGEHAGVYFIAMEYVHGVSLGDLLARLRNGRRRLAPKLCVYLAAQIAEALHAAHDAADEQGQPLAIVHRNVCPSNVLMTHTGHVKLIDFGIAKSQLKGALSGDTGVGAMGELRYMAPEQALSSRVDRRADVYALGALLWEMLTGRSVFRTTSVASFMEDRQRPVPSPSRCHTGLDTSLDAAVLKALRLDREERFGTALEFRRALLTAMPEAACLDAPRVAHVLGAFVGAEMQARRQHLPEPLSRELAAQERRDSDTREESLNELTLEAARAGAVTPRDLDASQAVPVTERPGEVVESPGRGPSQTAPHHRSPLGWASSPWVAGLFLLLSLLAGVVFGREATPPQAKVATPAAASSSANQPLRAPTSPRPEAAP